MKGPLCEVMFKKTDVFLNMILFIYIFENTITSITMAHLENLSVGVFIDGGYYAKINEGLQAKEMASGVNLKALFAYLLDHISSKFKIERRLLYITEAHYYRGRFRAQEALAKDLLLSEREFEDTLIENDIIFHYKHMRTTGKNGETIIEKGIDTWFALDTYEMTLFREFDYVVLISGDADHEMLARKLKALKTHVVLMTWDPANTGSTSKFLSEEACTHVNLNTLTANDANLFKRITKPLLAKK